MSFKKAILIFLILLTCMSLAWGKSFVVNKIEIEGLQRISLGTVLSYMPIKAGDRLNDSETSSILNTLYQTGFFSEVSLYRENNNLIIKVVENPTISSINISGNKKIKTKDLMSALKSTGIVQGRVFDSSVLTEIRQALLDQYYNLGHYDARVATTATQVGRNRVAVTIVIVEGPVAKIKKINIIGNKSFTNQELLEDFSLSRPTILTIINQGDLYSREKLNADLEKLRSYYLDRGYMEFRIDDTKVSMTPDKEHVYIVIHVTEGPVYKISSVQLSGNLLGKKTELQKFISVKSGDVFSRKQVMTNVDAIKMFFGNYGYAAANADPQITMDRNKHLVSLNFMIKPGRRVYIRKIDFFGNTKTADYVLRREMRQMEGGQFNLSQIKESTYRLYNLGYLKDIQPQLKPIPDHPSEDDLQYNLKESSSATANVQVGYSDSDGLLYGGSLSEHNFLGSGRSVGVSINNSQYNQVYSLNYYNPYFTMNNVGFGVNIFGQRMTPDKDQNISSYTQNNLGGTATYYFPMSEHNRISLGFGYEHPMIKTNDASAQTYVDFVNNYGRIFDLPKLSAGWSYSNADRAVFPTKGLTQSVSVEVAVPIFERGLGFYKAIYQATWYYPIFRKYFILDTHLYLGFGDGFGRDDSLPFFENFFAGGLGTVRGYDDYSLGPKAEDGNSIGGNVSMNGSIGIIFPNPLGETVRTSVFVDAGDIYTTHSLSSKEDTNNVRGIRLGLLRYSVGVQLEWRTPFAPLVFSLAEPIHMRPGDRKHMFQFQIGASF